MANWCPKIDGNFRLEAIRSPKSHDIHTEDGPCWTESLTELDMSCLQSDRRLKMQDEWLKALEQGYVEDLRSETQGPRPEEIPI